MNMVLSKSQKSQRFYRHCCYRLSMYLPFKRIYLKLFCSSTPTWRLWRHVQTLYIAINFGQNFLTWSAKLGPRPSWRWRWTATLRRWHHDHRRMQPTRSTFDIWWSSLEWISSSYTSRRCTSFWTNSSYYRTFSRSFFCSTARLVTSSSFVVTKWGTFPSNSSTDWCTSFSTSTFDCGLR
jgi:hypothetical protein